MGYQALLFCPDEKTARTVTQVLSELDFNVTPCTEPFAAVKKLMGERFDAVVVDCDNEQNATLLFKSARNAPNNQSSLAVAVVEGQAGVAKAFRIGANLVLTKPINVEQAKGTLRVARGLLRKNEGTKPAGVAATPAMKPTSPAPPPAPSATRPVPTAAVPVVPARRPAPPVAPPPQAPVIFTQKPAQQPSVVASTPIEITDATLDAIEEACDPSASLPETTSALPSAPKIVSTASVTAAPERKSSGGFAASAPAPARYLKPTPSVVNKPSSVVSQPAHEAAKTDVDEKPSSLAMPTAVAPSFTLGAVADEATPSTGGSKKAILAAVATVVLAACAYAAWTQWGHSGATASAPARTAEQPAPTPAPVQRATPSTAPTPNAAAAASDIQTPAPQASANAANAPARANKIIAPAPESSKPSASMPSATKTLATNMTPPPMVIKNNRPQTSEKSEETTDAPALSVTDIAQGNDGALPNLMGPSDTPAPVLQKMTVSQGVSRGLLVKQVQPVYPRGALQMHVEGAVQLAATISKTGDISEVKVLKGDSQLAHAAMDAVRQWKYKPYLLNGEPVDIQTQITVNFKLPH
jgi:periplasmic protein TonB